MNRTKNYGMRILPVIRSEEKAKTVYGELWGREDLFPVLSDITAPDFNEKVKEISGGRLDYIIHYPLRGCDDIQSDGFPTG